MNLLSDQLTNFLSLPLKRRKQLFLLLTIFAGFIILIPYLDYQPFLAQGDHGRDLYSFKKASEGGIPYKDFYTNNGPLMPYYYSFFYFLFGANISSTLIGYNLCILLTGVLIYLICSTYLDPLFSFCGALWYWTFRGNEFFYTYNHTGGIVMMLAAVYCLILYIKHSHAKHIYMGFLCIIALLLIRPTIGLSTLTAFSLVLIYQKWPSNRSGQRKLILKYAFIALSIFAGVFLIYWLLTKNLPRYIGFGEMAYWKHFNPENIARGLTALYEVSHSYFLSSIPKIIVTCIAALSLSLTLVKLKNYSSDKDHKKELRIVLGLIIILAILNLGELFATGIWFYALWNLSLIAIILMHALNIGFCHLGRVTKYLIVSALFLLPFIILCRTFNFMGQVKQPANQLIIGNNKIYLHLSQRPSIPTLSHASMYLFMHVGENEKFLAIPYDPIYYFLSNRDSATRQLVIFNLSSEKEKDLLAEMEKNQVRHILISNRAYRDSDERLGVLGKDYGKKLQKYIDDRFFEVAAYGPWDAVPGWTANHAVKIYQRK